MATGSGTRGGCPARYLGVLHNKTCVLQSTCVAHHMLFNFTGDVLHDGDVLAHVLLGGTACVPILCRLPPNHAATTHHLPRIDRICLAPGDEVVAGQPVAYMARADQLDGHGITPSSASSTLHASPAADTRLLDTECVAATTWRSPLQLLRQRSMSLLASLQRMSSSGGSVTCTGPALHHTAAAV